MTNATGEAKSGPLRLGFDSSVQLLFRGSAISSDGGLLLHRELDDPLGLTDLASGLLADHRTGKNGRHTFVGYCGSRFSLVWPAMRTSTMPTGSAVIRSCASWLVVGQ